MRLEGKVALISGASNGIGLATARRFVREGAHVFITARRARELEQAKAEIADNVTAVQGDVSNLGDLDRLVSIIRETKGVLDIIVSSAGFAEPVTLEDTTPEQFDTTFGVNTRGPLFLVQKALPLLRDGASIVLVASGAHSSGFPPWPTYAASKAAVRSFARTMAAGLAERNVRVNAVSPGPVDTGIIDLMFPDSEVAEQARGATIETVPMRRFGRPEEIANAILFLASDEASYITGADVPVDGGQTQL